MYTAGVVKAVLVLYGCWFGLMCSNFFIILRRIDREQAATVVLHGLSLYINRPIRYYWVSAVLECVSLLVSFRPPVSVMSSSMSTFLRSNNRAAILVYRPVLQLFN